MSPRLTVVFDITSGIVAVPIDLSSNARYKRDPIITLLQIGPHDIIRINPMRFCLFQESKRPFIQPNQIVVIMVLDYIRAGGLGGNRALQEIDAAAG